MTQTTASMTYALWDKKSDINGKTALELIGQEQIDNDDPFIIFTDDNVFESLQSVATLKATYGFTGATADEVAAEYIKYRATYIPPQTTAQKLETVTDYSLTALDAVAQTYEENQALIAENEALKKLLDTAHTDNLTALEAIAELYEASLTKTT